MICWLPGCKTFADEAKDLEVITIEDKVYNINFFVGGGLKSLALVRGMDAAKSVRASMCIV